MWGSKTSCIGVPEFGALDALVASPWKTRVDDIATSALRACDPASRRNADSIGTFVHLCSCHSADDRHVIARALVRARAGTKVPHCPRSLADTPTDQAPAHESPRTRCDANDGDHYTA